MLSNLLKGVEPISSVLIQDSVVTSGSAVLHALIQENVTRLSNHAIHVVCFESPPTRMTNHLKLDNSSSHIEFHDYCTNHRGWVKPSSTVDRDVASLLTVKLDRKIKNLLIVDSLSTLICRIGFHETYRQLHELIESDVQLVCLVHEDFLPDNTASITKLRHLFSTCLQIVASSNSYDERVLVVCTHTKKGGKVVRSSEECSVDSDNKVTFHKMADAKKTDASKPIKVDTIPKELTTFKLDLGDKEKVARDKLVLPYLRPEGGGGKVFYEPDDADDWDEEDPDDDLDV